MRRLLFTGALLTVLVAAVLPMATPSVAQAGSVTALVLVNADTDTDIGPMSDGIVLNLATLPTRNLNVRADVTGSVGSVRFALDANINFRTENTAPYALAGDSPPGSYHPWTPSVGEHSMAATAYGGPDATGEQGGAIAVAFTVTDEPPVDPTSTPLPTETPVPPLPTDTPVPDPSTATPTNSVFDPTATFEIPTNTPVPTDVPTEVPTATHTHTPVPPTATATTPPDVFEGVPACSAARHNAWVTQAPDGVWYPTWHPLIDSENGAPCSHRHDHGSNPATLHPDWHPAFGYTAAKAGMVEGHTGFKVNVIPGPNDQPTGVMVHMGGHALQRICVRFHSFETAWLNNDGSLGAVITIMADFGKSKHNDTGQTLTPPDCAGGIDPNVIVNPLTGAPETTTGVKFIPVVGGTIGYEPWRMDLKKTVFGFIGDWTINSRSAHAVCKVRPSCVIGDPHLTNETGTDRFVTPNRDPATGLKFTLDQSRASVGASGAFCTDPYGRTVISCGAAGAVHQFVAPGLFASYPCGHHAAGGRGGAMLVCGSAGGVAEDVNEPGGVKPGAAN